MARIVCAVFLLALVSSSQGSAQAQPSPEFDPQPPADSDRLNAIQKRVDSIAEDLGLLKKDVVTIRDYTEPRIIDFRQLPGDQVSNFIWEVIGYKKTEKTVVGKAITLGGTLVTLISLYMKLVLKHDKMPRVLIGAVYAYAAFAMVALGFTAFASAPATSQPAVELDTTRLERRLDGIDQRLTEVRASTQGIAESAGLVSKLDDLQRTSLEVSQGVERLNSRVSQGTGGSNGVQTLLLLVIVGLVGVISWKVW
jgi:hypothetical protein